MPQDRRMEERDQQIQDSGGKAVYKTVIEDVLYTTIAKKHKGIISSDELGLKCEEDGLILPCGSYARWEKEWYK